MDREGSVCVFVVFRFRGQSVSRAVSHKGGDETKRARLCFFAKTVSTRFLRARASFREDGKQSGSAVGRVGRSARFVSRVVGGADASRRSRLVAHLHDGRAVVRNGGHALVVVHELVQASRALRDRRSSWSAEIRNRKGAGAFGGRICGESVLLGDVPGWFGWSPPPPCTR